MLAHDAVHRRPHSRAVSKEQSQEEHENMNLQFMFYEAWDTIELNKIDIDKDLAKFFGKPDWKRK